MPLFKRKTVVLAALLALSALANAAHAEYICEVTILENAHGSTYGDHGFVLARYHTERNCGGNFVIQQWFCTANATGSGCAANPRYHYSEQGLMALYESLTGAAFWGRQVRFSRVGCFGGYSDCAGNIYITSRY